MDFQLVDVFTSTPYSGNGLCVFLDTPGLGAAQLGRITLEMRQFESIFLEATSAPRRWRARIFDLVEELDFAGHPVLGAAAVLHERLGGDTQRWTLELPAAVLTVDTERRGPGRYRAELPHLQARFLTAPRDVSRAEVASWFGLDSLDARLPLEVMSTGLRYLVVPVPPGALSGARVVHRELTAALGALGADYAYLLDADAIEGRHWNNDGVVEDAATGSAAGCVAGYLHRHGLLGSGERAALRQGRFANRPSTIDISARSEGDALEVSVGGDVVMVGSGRLDVTPEADGA